jgi:hypothetical protein
VTARAWSANQQATLNLVRERRVRLKALLDNLTESDGEQAVQDLMPAVAAAFSERWQQGSVSDPSFEAKGVRDLQEFGTALVPPLMRHAKRPVSLGTALLMAEAIVSGGSLETIRAHLPRLVEQHWTGWQERPHPQLGREHDRDSIALEQEHDLTSIARVVTGTLRQHQHHPDHRATIVALEATSTMPGSANRHFVGHLLFPLGSGVPAATDVAHRLALTGCIREHDRTQHPDLLLAWLHHRPLPVIAGDPVLMAGVMHHALTGTDRADRRLEPPLHERYCAVMGRLSQNAACPSREPV